MTQALAAAGWHGKLPTLGDFATRRLGPDFVEPWDAWLSEGIAALRRRDDWLQAYLASPSWRFILMPGVMPGPLGEQGWAGVLMPSVDRVGRYYPLTLAHPMGTWPTTGDALDAIWRWLLQLDEAAADALQDDWDIDTLEAELQRLGPPPHGDPTSVDTEAPEPLREIPLAGHRHAAAAIAARSAALGLAHQRGQAFWYAESGLSAPRLMVSRGLETGRLVTSLLGAVDDNAAMELQPAP